MVLTGALAVVLKIGRLLAKGRFLSVLNNIPIGFNSIPVSTGSSLAGSFDKSLRNVFKFSLMNERITDCSLEMYKARVVLLRGLAIGALGWLDVRTPSLKTPNYLRSFPTSWSISTIAKTLASTVPFYALTVHHNFSSSASMILVSIYLCFSRVNVELK